MWTAASAPESVLVINDTHYGRVEDAQMGICHMLCYAFMENPLQDEADFSVARLWLS